MNFFELLEEELALLVEASTRITINSRGQRKRVATRKVQQRRGNKTRNMSRAARKRAAKRSARTRRRDTSGTRKAVRRRGKAMRLRRQRGLS